MFRLCLTCSESIQNGPGWSQKHSKPPRKKEKRLLIHFAYVCLYMFLQLLPIGSPIGLPIGFPIAFPIGLPIGLPSGLPTGWLMGLPTESDLEMCFPVLC